MADNTYNGPDFGLFGGEAKRQYLLDQGQLQARLAEINAQMNAAKQLQAQQSQLQAQQPTANMNAMANWMSPVLAQREQTNFTGNPMAQAPLASATPDQTGYVARDMLLKYGLPILQQQGLLGAQALGSTAQRTAAENVGALPTSSLTGALDNFARIGQSLAQGSKGQLASQEAQGALPYSKGAGMWNELQNSSSAQGRTMFNTGYNPSANQIGSTAGNADLMANIASALKSNLSGEQSSTGIQEETQDRQAKLAIAALTNALTYGQGRGELGVLQHLGTPVQPGGTYMRDGNIVASPMSLGAQYAAMGGAFPNSPMGNLGAGRIAPTYQAPTAEMPTNIFTGSAGATAPSPVPNPTPSASAPTTQQAPNPFPSVPALSPALQQLIQSRSLQDQAATAKERELFDRIRKFIRPSSTATIR